MSNPRLQAELLGDQRIVRTQCDANSAPMSAASLMILALVVCVRQPSYIFLEIVKWIPGWGFKSLDFERGTFFRGLQTAVGRPLGTFSQRPGKILQRLMGVSDFASFYVPT